MSNTVATKRLVSHLLVVAFTVVGASCIAADNTAESSTGPDDSRDPTTSTELSTTVGSGAAATVISDELAALPVRDGPREETTQSVPHVQLDASPVPEVDAELRRRAFSLPGVINAESGLSLPGARGLWLSDDIEPARPEVFQFGTEFAHIHPDGSLHVWLPVERAVEVDEAKWGELHPWVGRDGFWDGVVMVFTPETLDEVDVVIQLVVESYNYVTGLSLDPEAF